MGIMPMFDKGAILNPVAAFQTQLELAFVTLFKYMGEKLAKYATVSYTHLDVYKRQVRKSSCEIQGLCICLARIPLPCVSTRIVVQIHRKQSYLSLIHISSARNAQRLARTETNIAYRTADFERWAQLDFVVGIEITIYFFSK